MRLLLLIMTGIGFTLGLLCGLLLQLPAEGLPASIHSDDSISNNHHHHDVKGRWRRSVGDQDVVLKKDVPGQSVHSLSQGNGNGDGSGPNPGMKPNLFASSGRDADNGHRPVAKPGANQAEPIALTTKTGQRAGEAGRFQDKPHPPVPPITSRPVTSFTLRLKNTGGRFVVDSAVPRQNNGAGRAGLAPGVGDNDVYTAHLKPNNTTDTKAWLNNKTLTDVVHGVLWSNKLDDLCPGGLEPRDVSAWRRKAAGMAVVKMEEGCGRMQNRLVTFKDGSQACARYRLNTDQIQGEVYSYYLAHLLNITNLPPAILLPVDTLSPQWRNVHLEMSLAQWADGRLVVLTRRLDDLLPSHIPHELREDDRKLHPTVDILGKKTVPELCDLLQWSDLIVFDYLTANLDRMVNNMFNRQWNAEMMNNPAHNLERTKSGNLVFLDNESGLFHGYRLLEKYHSYHESLLSSLCVFRESTAKAVKNLHRSQSVGQDLQRVFEEGELHHKHLPSIPEKNVNVLQERLTHVYDQIVHCEALYPGGRR